MCDKFTLYFLISLFFLITSLRVDCHVTYNCIYYNPLLNTHTLTLYCLQIFDIMCSPIRKYYNDINYFVFCDNLFKSNLFLCYLFTAKMSSNIDSKTPQGGRSEVKTCVISCFYIKHVCLLFYVKVKVRHCPQQRKLFIVNYSRPHLKQPSDIWANILLGTRKTKLYIP